MIKNTNNIMPEGVAISTPHKSHTNIENSVNYSNLFLEGTFMGGPSSTSLPYFSVTHFRNKTVARMIKMLLYTFYAI